MKKVIALFLALVMMTGLVACGGKSESGDNNSAKSAQSSQSSEKKANENEQVTISWGIYETDNLTADKWDAVISSFEADNPNIKIKKVVAVGDSRPNFWMTMAASGTFPDIVTEAEQLVVYEPSIFAEVPADIQDLFEPGAIATYGGKVVTVPYMKQLRMQCYYNKADFEAYGLSEPKTFDEFLNICKTLKDAGKIPLICGGTGDVWATGEPWWISVTNQSILKKYPNFIKQINSGELTWTDPVIIETLGVWKSLIDAGYYHPGCMSWSYSQAAAEFQNGEASMMIDGSWAAAGFDAAGNENFGVFVIPSPDGADGYCCPVSYWGVSAKSQQEEAAWTFIKWFFTNKEAYGLLLKADGLNSTTKDPVTYEQGPVMTKFVKNLEGLELYPEIVKAVGDNSLPGGIENALCKAMQMIFTGMDITEAMQSVQNEQEMAMNEK